ncbi:hypothetical protein HYH03_001880 [Edaphochlamys debaryana]|uniref:Uncharacterized protein n=1 Tax=Edaphochlamys debaryana TaxID=47281 RepID=A0A835YFJ9_9CHLO|nr:hypothetical protein HYH03_001880 [Edaphochlamys debaryana]|eukprot:KAG2500303.1 hypothetical protein HYH03_001880 [Edaphochlamys debaryana]
MPPRLLLRALVAIACAVANAAQSPPADSALDPLRIGNIGVLYPVSAYKVYFPASTPDTPYIETGFGQLGLNYVFAGPVLLPVCDTGTWTHAAASYACQAGGFAGGYVPPISLAKRATIPAEWDFVIVECPEWADAFTDCAYYQKDAGTAECDSVAAAWCTDTDILGAKGSPAPRRPMPGVRPIPTADPSPLEPALRAPAGPEPFAPEPSAPGDPGTPPPPRPRPKLHPPPRRPRKPPSRPKPTKLSPPPRAAPGNSPHPGSPQYGPAPPVRRPVRRVRRRAKPPPPPPPDAPPEEDSRGPKSDDAAGGDPLGEEPDYAEGEGRGLFACMAGCQQACSANCSVKCLQQCVFGASG